MTPDASNKFKAALAVEMADDQLPTGLVIGGFINLNSPATQAIIDSFSVIMNEAEGIETPLQPTRLSLRVGSKTGTFRATKAQISALVESADVAHMEKAHPMRRISENGQSAVGF